MTCELARRGHRMTGVDPARAMLDVARHRPWGENVRWIEGDATRLGDTQADLAIMTGYVAGRLRSRLTGAMSWGFAGAGAIVEA